MQSSTTAALEFKPASVQTALNDLLKRISPISNVETVALFDAQGRVLAQEIVAKQNVPAFPTSMMDGYALCSKNLSRDDRASPQIIRSVLGKSLAGHPLLQDVDQSACVRIFTGAMLPAGFDVVVPQELVEVVGESQVRLPTDACLRVGHNVRPVGEDFLAGGVALPEGRRLGARELGLLASLGFARVPVVRPVRVAVLSTGDEVKDLHRPLAGGQIYDANRLMLLELVRREGGIPIDLGITPDEPGALDLAIRQAANVADLVITSGGVSVGEADHTRAVMSTLGEVSFWRLSIKPGRPLAAGFVWSDEKKPIPFFGLPGNPVASFVTFVAVVRHGLAKLAGSEQGVKQFTLRARVDRDLRKQLGRTEYLRCRLMQDDDGGWSVHILASQGAASLKSLVEADGLAVLPEDVDQLNRGDWVDVISLRDL